MAGKNEVVLTFAGDATQLEKAAAKADSSLKGFERSAEGVGKGLERGFDSGGKAADRMGGRIERAGERADNSERSFTGLASGIDGVTSLMDNPSPQEFAQGIADISDGIANSAAPALGALQQKLFGTTAATSAAAEGLDMAGDAAEGTSGKMKGLTQALGTAGVIGAVAGAAFALDSWVDSQRQADFDATARGFEATGDASKLAGEAMDFSGGGMGRYADRLLELGQTDLPAARSELEALRASGELHPALYAQMAAGLEEMAGGLRVSAYESTAAEDALRSYSEAVAAQMDPVLGFIDAQRQNAEAMSAVNAAEMLLAAAVDEHGANSIEAMVAQQALTEAQWANVSSANAAQLAAHSLAEGFNDGSVRGGAFEARLRTLAQAGMLDADTMRAISRETGIAYGELARIAGVDPNITITSNAFQVAGGIATLQDRINNLRGKDVFIRYVGTGVGVAQNGTRLVAAGGPVYAAAGMSLSGGPRGTDTVPAWLTPGEMVLNAGQQRRLFDVLDGRGTAGGGGGGGTTNVYVQGSILTERDLQQMFYDWQDRGGRR